MRNTFFTIAVASIAAVGLAFYYGWLDFQTVHSPDGDRTQVQLNIDREKVRHDTEAARAAVREGVSDLKQEAREIKDNVSAAARADRVEGVITEIDPVARRLTAMADAMNVVTVELAADARVKIDGRDAALADLKDGDAVQVAYERKDGRNIASSVTVRRES